MRLIITAVLGALVFLAYAPQPGGEGTVVRRSAVVDASIEDVWRAFTTREGLESSFGVRAAMERFAVGAEIRTHDKPAARARDGGWIRHRILSFEPRSMISARFLAADGAPESEAPWTVTRFEALDSGRTRVTVTLCCGGSGPAWDRACARFKECKAFRLERLQKRFAKKNTGADPWPGLLRLAKDAWVGDRVEKGAVVFRVRNTGQPGPGERSLLFIGRMGPPQALRYHAHTQVWRDASGAVRLHCVDEKGRAFKGRIEARSADHLRWTWTEVEGPERFVTDTVFIDEDRYRFDYFVPRNGEQVRAMSTVFRREKRSF